MPDHSVIARFDVDTKVLTGEFSYKCGPEQVNVYVGETHCIECGHKLDWPEIEPDEDQIREAQEDKRDSQHRAEGGF